MLGFAYNLVDVDIAVPGDVNIKPLDGFYAFSMQDIQDQKHLYQQQYLAHSYGEGEVPLVKHSIPAY
jgi:hypothetical protein